MSKVEIKQTKNKGKGIFARKDFKKGEEILYITGETVATDNPSEFPEHIREHWGPIDEEGNKIVYVLPEEPWMYMNHSCDPNAGIKDNRNLIAIRDIKKGEEICIDYSTLFVEGWKMECHCGSKNCRKNITTFDKLKPEDQERLKEYASSYVKKKYLKK